MKMTKVGFSATAWPSTWVFRATKFFRSIIFLTIKFQTTEITKRHNEEKKANRSDNEDEDDHDQHDSKEQRLTLMEEVI